ncbi:YceI family protein [Kribbella sp. DT2]|uniref:YceI family protein n=1 Tax=Kribbella sp. DT2 TaxID=3393427 RepID=UPI003CF474C4
MNPLTGDYSLSTPLDFTVRQGFGRVGGRFEKVEGSASFDGDEPSRSSVQVTIRTVSIQTGTKRRDAHLRRSYLRTDAHPLATFASTEVVQLDGAGFRVSGVLTLRGVPKSVTFDLRRDGLRFAGELTLDRRDWQVEWNAVAEGWGLFVGYDVIVRLDVSATRSPRAAESATNAVAAPAE